MPRSEPDCPFQVQLPAFLQGELDEGLRNVVAAHLGQCPSCRREIAGLRRLLSSLQSLPVDSPPRDFAPRILDQVREPGTSRPTGSNLRARALAGFTAAAAVLLLAIGTGEQQVFNPAVHVAGTRSSAEAVRLGVDWLVRSQEVDGSWSARRHGGDLPYDVGLTGLALLALLESGREDPQVMRTVERATMFLMGSQEEDGRFGPKVSGDMYNHGPATVALLRLEARHRWGPLSRALDRALARILSAQDPGGGWGYRDPPRGRTNVVVSFWPLRALDLARASGRGNLQGAVAAARRWLEGLRDPQGRIGYSQCGEWPLGPETTTVIGTYGLRMAGAPGFESDDLRVRDLLGLYCLSGLRPDGVEDAVRRMNDLQIVTGPHQGSWPAMDAFGSTGGRVYNTSMSVLVASVIGPALSTPGAF
jgi:anti-sigma factor RsiW